MQSCPALNTTRPRRSASKQTSLLTDRYGDGNADSGTTGVINCQAWLPIAAARRRAEMVRRASVHRSFDRERIEQRDRMFAAVAREVSVVAVDHRDARAHEARDRYQALRRRRRRRIDGRAV